MLPGMEEALQFYKTRKIPLGSWHNWLQACYVIVEKKFKFTCSWAMLVGISAGMLEIGGVSCRNEFNRVAASEYKRSTEKRFLAFFVSLVDALAGASDVGLRSRYRGLLGIGLRRKVPPSPLRWPSSDCTAKTTISILESIQPSDTSFPIARDNYEDFYVNLLYGYYLATHNDAALECLFDEFQLQESRGTQAATFDLLLHNTPSLAEWFANEIKRRATENQ